MNSLKIRLKTSFLVVLAFLSHQSPAFAKINGLFIWEQNTAKLILPELEGKTQDSIPGLYKKALESSKEYAVFRPFYGKGGTIGEEFPKGKFSSIPQLKSPLSLVPFALFANEPGFMNPNYRPFQNFKRSFTDAGAPIFTIPFGMDSLLSDPNDLKTYIRLISNSFPAFISPGGDDVDPFLYGEKNLYAKNPNRARDLLEFKLIRGFIEKDQGVFYGICRGHQVYAAVMGGKLIQDIPVDLSPNVIHRPTKNPDGTLSSSWHSITLTGKDNSLFQSVGKESFMVNSRHHQAVKSIPPEGGDVVALAGGNMIEAIEKKDAKGQVRALTYQFHPEDMDSEESAKLIQYMIEQARKAFALRSK